MADIDKIAEIVCPICMYGCDCLIRSKRDKPECPTVTNLVALIAADRAGLVEALQCAEYAFIHPESNQQFALKAVQDAITQIEQALKEGK